MIYLIRFGYSVIFCLNMLANRLVVKIEMFFPADLVLNSFHMSITVFSIIYNVLILTKAIRPGNRSGGKASISSGLSTRFV
jgi:hypothetical protein